jgi:hypothetical protein
MVTHVLRCPHGQQAGLVVRFGTDRPVARRGCNARRKAFTPQPRDRIPWACTTMLARRTGLPDPSGGPAPSGAWPGASGAEPASMPPPGSAGALSRGCSGDQLAHQPPPGLTRCRHRASRRSQAFYRRLRDRELAQQALQFGPWGRDGDVSRGVRVEINARSLETIGEVETGRTSPAACHIGGREFESRQPRQPRGGTPDGAPFCAWAGAMIDFQVWPLRQIAPAIARHNGVLPHRWPYDSTAIASGSRHSRRSAARQPAATGCQRWWGRLQLAVGAGRRSPHRLAPRLPDVRQPWMAMDVALVQVDSSQPSRACGALFSSPSSTWRAAAACGSWRWRRPWRRRPGARAGERGGASDRRRSTQDPRMRAARDGRRHARRRWGTGWNRRATRLSGGPSATRSRACARRRRRGSGARRIRRRRRWRAEVEGESRVGPPCFAPRRQLVHNFCASA